MPYVNKEEREQFDKILDQLPGLETKGQLEYCIFKLMKWYMTKREHRYSILHDVVYAAIHCGDEFRRRYLDKREDEALNKNGDVF